MGLSTQVPFTEEISSNYAPASVREVTIKNRKYIIRRPTVEVTDENVTVLQLLDCLKDIERCAEEEPEVCGKRLHTMRRSKQLEVSHRAIYLSNSHEFVSRVFIFGGCLAFYSYSLQHFSISRKVA